MKRGSLPNGITERTNLAFGVTTDMTTQPGATLDTGLGTAPVKFIGLLASVPAPYGNSGLFSPVPWLHMSFFQCLSLDMSRLRGANVRVEKRLDDSLAVRLGERYLAVRKYAMPDPRKAPPAMKTTKAKAHRGGRGSDWNKNFNMKTGPKVWQAAPASGCRPEEAIQ